MAWFGWTWCWWESSQGMNGKGPAFQDFISGSSDDKSCLCLISSQPLRDTYKDIVASIRCHRWGGERCMYGEGMWWSKLWLKGCVINCLGYMSWGMFVVCVCNTYGADGICMSFTNSSTCIIKQIPYTTCAILGCCGRARVDQGKRYDQSNEQE